MIFDGPLIFYCTKGLTPSIPKGGHCPPNSILGEMELWKKAQKIVKKKNTSETINKPTPKFKPLWTAYVWLPKKVS